MWGAHKKMGRPSGSVFGTDVDEALNIRASADTIERGNWGGRGRCQGRRGLAACQHACMAAGRWAGAQSPRVGVRFEKRGAEGEDQRTSTSMRRWADAGHAAAGGGHCCLGRTSQEASNGGGCSRPVARTWRQRDGVASDCRRKGRSIDLAAASTPQS